MTRPTAPVRLAILAVGIVYSIILYLSGVELDSFFKRLAAVLPALGAIAVTFWDVLLWRMPLFKHLTRRPRIDGLWSVELTPTAESHIPPGGNKGPIPAYMTVSQSYWSVHVRQFTAESSSRSRTFFWWQANGADIECLTFIYENDPKQSHQHRSGRHVGTCVFDIATRSPRLLSGVYFTDRYTKGDLEAQLIDRTKGYSSFDDIENYINMRKQVAP
ncbi:Cap15 family cyclic dinucleotide receptor domain-containing protein [Kribbella monticola]|uniref:Cap15 family cyclic dinucleotide receptor domain-containing protein n=1 Tax=Kribbella monticola TaxID=2185285 RepID=UPI00130042B0|nr:hypothetical protein [Kribbella monticola]